MDQGCDLSGNFSVVVHGWTESINTPWAEQMISHLLEFRGGCLFFMDYSNFSQVPNYFELVRDFEGISAVLVKKFEQIGMYDRQFCFGFSFGSRLCIDAGIAVGGAIDRIDACEPAGPGFDGTAKAKDPKLAAKNVACINTSTDKGTSVYNCHQNFRMGKCGKSQPAAGPRPLGNHGLCPYFYVKAFDFKFAPNNFFDCKTKRLARIGNQDVRMGYLMNFNRNLIQGDIFIATAKFPPYLVLDSVIENTPAKADF